MKKLILALLFVASAVQAGELEVLDSKNRPKWDVETKDSSFVIKERNNHDPSAKRYGTINSTDKVTIKNQYGKKSDLKGVYRDNGYLKLEDKHGTVYKGYINSDGGTIRDNHGNSYRVRKK